MVEESFINANQPIHDLGVDSLVAGEIFKKAVDGDIRYSGTEQYHFDRDESDKKESFCYKIFDG